MMKKNYVSALVTLAIFLTGCGAAGPSQDAESIPAGAVGSAPETVAAAAVPETSQPDTGAKKDDAPEPPSGFLFEVKGLTIQMGEPAPPVIAALGEPVNYFEAPSCAFEGIDKIYYYSGFELYTYPAPADGNDYILSIILTDDSVSTVEGVYLGMAFSNMENVYGDDYAQNFGLYTYSLDDSTLSFFIEDDVITAITYKLIVNI